ncbi:hypothetical protein AVEN_192441-1 [Araneus ventricosus]|uniref:Uncharacterized protein n=1 Tax=Araneus ventricosus TaxID=182803 RepID=A0A4Y2WX30_ARAVE|nr:hypothetical protein AVEN_192441-1 [Araneus ventricosus]
MAMFRMAEVCVLRFQKCLTQLEGKKSGKMSGINLEEYLTSDDDLLAFEGVTEENNTFRLRFRTEITDEMENDDEEDDDTDISQSLSTSIGVAPVGGLGGSSPRRGINR